MYHMGVVLSSTQSKTGLHGSPVLGTRDSQEHSRASSMSAVRYCLIHIWNEEQKRTLITLGGGFGYV